jgi:hypothetical protein
MAGDQEIGAFYEREMPRLVLFVTISRIPRGPGREDPECGPKAYLGLIARSAKAGPWADPGPGLQHFLATR